MQILRSFGTLCSCSTVNVKNDQFFFFFSSIPMKNCGGWMDMCAGNRGLTFFMLSITIDIYKYIFLRGYLKTVWIFLPNLYYYSIFLLLLHIVLICSRRRNQMYDAFLKCNSSIVDHHHIFLHTISYLLKVFHLLFIRKFIDGELQ